MHEYPNDTYVVRESTAFQSFVEQLGIDVPRWDEMRRGLDWALHRNPTHPSIASRVVPDGPFWTHIMPVSGHSTLLVLYSVDDDTKTVTYEALGRGEES